ncbi:MAG: hypothetical protein WCU88_12105 [Elusimicrobiota bacterium]
MRFDKRAAGCAAAAALAALVLIYWRTGYAGRNLVDLFLLMDRPYRVFMGQIPYRDFDCVTTPLTYFIEAGLFRVFGIGFGVSRWYMALQGAFLSALTVLLLHRFMRLRMSFSAAGGIIAAAWSTQFISGYPWYGADAIAFILTGLAAFMAAWESRSLAWTFLSGLFFSAAFWCKQDLGAAALLFGAPAFGILYQRRLRGPGAWRHIAAYGLGMALPFALFILFYARHDGLLAMRYWIVERALRFKIQHSGGGIGSNILRTFSSEISQFGKLLAFVYLMGVLIPLRMLRRTSSEREKDLLWRNLSVGGIFFGVYYTSFMSHYATLFEAIQAGLGLVIGGIFSSLGCGRADCEDRLPRLGKAALLAATAAISLRSLWYLRQELVFPPTGAYFSPVLNARFGGARIHKKEAETVNAILGFVGREIRADESFFVLPIGNMPDVYFLTGRMPVHPVTSSIPTEWEPEDEKRLIESLRKSRVRWAFILGGRAAQDMHEADRYLLENYRPYQRLSPNVEVLLRK